jgi:proteic killer suppression protein
MIKSYASKETKKIFEGNQSRKLPPEIQHAARRKLFMIDATDELHDLQVPPGNRLEKLEGNRVDQHSIRINDQWRICFTWKSGNAFDVEIIDYHKGK